MKILITGGAGFIESALVRIIINNTDHGVINLDCLTRAGNEDSFAVCESSEHYFFELLGISSNIAVQDVFRRHCPDLVMHLAAESHVDRSIDGPIEFMQTNILATFNLLKRSREYFEGLTESAQKLFRFLHVSTDEFYGDLDGPQDLFTEDTSCPPSSPYSVSKAASRHLGRAGSRVCLVGYRGSRLSDGGGAVRTYSGKQAASKSGLFGGNSFRQWMIVQDYVYGAS